MTHGSTFSGYGAFDLAAYMLGWENVFNCDIDKHCQDILKHYYPNATQYEDITKTDFTIWRGRLDVLTGGFPCQDISIAGEKKGLAGARSRLFYHKIRATDEARPKIAIWESVGEVRKYMPEIIQSYSEIGYCLQWLPICASWFGFPHERKRVFGIAYNTDCFRWEQIQIQARIVEETIYEASKRELGRATCWKVQLEDYSKFLRMDDGISSGVCAEEIKAFGNSIIPSIAYELLSAINIQH